MSLVNIKKDGNWVGQPVLGFKVGEDNLTNELKEKIDNNSNVELDDSLTQSGKAADAKAVGEKFENLTAEDVGAVSSDYVKLIANPINLLDNSDFTNPVNQKGTVSGSQVDTYTYFLDRWVNGSTVAYPTFGANGLGNIENDIQQKLNLKAYVGKTLTLALYEAFDRPIYCCSGVVTNNSSWATIASSSNWECSIVSLETNVWAVQLRVPCKYVALYIGEYTLATLPIYRTKGYTGELTTCKQYNPQTGEYIGLVPESIGAAPSGYGLGDTAPFKTLDSASDLDNIWNNGWYLCHAPNNITIGGLQMNYIFLRTWSYDVGHIVQEIIPMGLSSLLRRIKISHGAWSEWEWENPPLYRGVEYRTTERLSGNPVYVKYMNYGFYTGGTEVTFPHEVSNILTPITIDLFNNNQEVLTNSVDYVNFNRTYIYFKASYSMGSVDLLFKYSKNA